MIDAAFTLAPAGDVVALDLWEGALPDLHGVRALRLEPTRWWLIDAAPHLETITTALAGRGACTPIGGGLVRATIAGPGWRDLLSVSGVFDAGNPAFAPGAVAGTVIHHVAVTIAVTGTEDCEVYCATSYAPTLEQLWKAAIANG